METRMSFDTKLPDFDTLAKLAKDDPAAFESLRTKLLEDAVVAAPARLQPSLRQTVATLNRAREGKTPLEAAAAANSAMLSSFRQLATSMNALHEECTGMYVANRLREIAAKR